MSGVGSTEPPGSGGAGFAGAGAGKSPALGCISASFPGRAAPGWILRRLEDGLGSVTLFASNIGDTAALTSTLHEANPQVAIAIDEEGGDVTRLEADRGSSYPGHLALGVVDDESVTESVAASIARDLAEVGIDLNFAPVADVNTNPANPVIGVRSFGSDPELAARHVAAFVRGTQSAGVAACAKHFPGHGDTSVDSHLDVPTVEGELAPALEPFRAAIAAGVRAIMVGHLRVPELDDAPATISPRIVDGLLRDELGFDGVVVTDALDMRAISDGIGVEEGAVRALAAGADLLCLGPTLGEDVVDGIAAAIDAAVESGRLSEDALRESAARVAAVTPLSGTVTLSRRSALGAAAARRAVVVDGDVELGVPPLVVELVPEPLIAVGEQSYGLGDFLPGARVVRLDGPPADAAALPDGRPLVLVLRDAHRHQWQREIADLVRADVIVETGLPAWRPISGAYVATHGAGRASLRAAAERIRP